MALIVSDIVYRTGVELGAVYEGTSTTTGTTTTIIDSNGLTQPDDYWNGSHVIILDSSTTTIEKVIKRITDYALTTHTLTTEEFSAAVPSGTRYAILKKRFPLDNVIQAINQALREYGNIPLVDTSLTSTTGIEYTLPSGVGANLKQVWMKSGDDDDDSWIEIHNWRVENNLSTNTNTLIFPTPLDNGYQLKLVYLGEHSQVTSYSDEINAVFGEEQIKGIVYRTAANVLNWRKNASQSVDPVLLTMIQSYESKANEYFKRYPVNSFVRRTPRFIKVK